MILDEIGNKGQITRKIYQRRLPENPSKDYYYIMRETGVTEPVLIEYGFIDNPNDLNKLNNNILDYAEGVVKAVAEYSGVPYVAPGGETPNGNVYTVKRGDSLYSIAMANNITVDELKTANNLTSNFLSIGQQLYIPKQEPQLPENYTIYTVKKGDSLYSIAQNFNTTVSEIVTLNKLNSTTLSIGENLLIPTGGIQIMDIVDYIVKPGDTLWKIASNCNVAVDDIVKFSNLESTILYPNQVIKLSESCAAKQEANNQEGIDENIYVVKKGDTLYSIARMFNTIPNELMMENNLTSTTLTIGQQLKVPQNDYIEYVVQRGDTLYSIALRYNTTPQAIKEINGLTSNLLQINQTILLPR